MAARASKKASDAKKKLIEGVVLKLHSEDLKIKNKTKRFLILAISEDKQHVAKLYFNSNCPTQPYQMQFNKEGRNYLYRKSYLDCSEIYDDNYHTILNNIIRNPNCIIGNMNKADLDTVKKQVSIAITISKSIKEKYGIPEETS